MSPPVSTSVPARIDELWKRIGAVLAGARAARAARGRSRGRRHRGPQRDAVPARGRRLGPRRRRAFRAASSRGSCPSRSRWTSAGTAKSCGCRSRPRAISTARCVSPACLASETPECAGLLAFLLGSLVGAHHLSRQVRDAEFELKARLLELESLYDLGLSLGGQLDLSALADEVLFRSISLTDAGKGTLVLFEESGAVLLERSVGGEVLAGRDAASWTLPGGRRHQQRRGFGADGRDEARGLREVPGRGDLRSGPAPRRPRGGRQGVARRARARLHADRRAAALALRQPGGRRDRDRAAPQGRDREGAHRARARGRRGDPAPDPAARPARRRGARDRREERAHAPGRRRLLRLLPPLGRAAGVSRRRRVGQGGSGRPARVDGPRRRAPPDRRSQDGGGAHRPHRPAPPEVRGDAQVPDVLLRAARAGLGNAAVRFRGAQPRAPAPGLRGDRAGQGDRRADRDVSQRLVAGGDGRDGAGRSALRLQRRHHRGARRGGRGVRPRSPRPG